MKFKTKCKMLQINQINQIKNARGSRKFFRSVNQYKCCFFTINSTKSILESQNHDIFRIGAFQKLFNCPPRDVGLVKLQT